MLDKQEFLEVGGERFPLAYTFNVVEKIQDKYGTITRWKMLMLRLCGEKEGG